jgi:hypothetical protein
MTTIAYVFTTAADGICHPEGVNGGGQKLWRSQKAVTAVVATLVDALQNA